MEKSHVVMEVGNDGVAVLTLSNPPVNILTNSCEGGKFCGGYDLDRCTQAQRTGNVSVLVQPSAVSIGLLTNIIEDAPKPSVAAIQGFAFGGGLDFALACHARISTLKAELSLPELAIGMIPGFGGTQRLPRLVGLSKAIDMLMTAKTITSEEGKGIGLIDAVVTPQELLNVSKMWALEIAERRKPWKRSLLMTDKLGSLQESRELFMRARQQVQRIARNMPHYLACLDVIEEGIVHGPYAGLIKEDKVFKELILTDTAKSLLHMQIAQRLTSKIPGVTDAGLKPRPVSTVAVIGGTSIGVEVATALILSNVHVIFKEIDAESLSMGLRSIEANIRGLQSKGKLAQDKGDKALKLIKGVLDYMGLRDVNIVIEAVGEDIPLKQKVFRKLEKACSPNCILATTTSTINLNIIGDNTRSQGRIVGAHFSRPAHATRLLEIARTSETRAQVIMDVFTLSKRMKKVSVVVSNCTGLSAVNRIFLLYIQSARLLVNSGVDASRIDRVITDFGFPVDPQELAPAFPDRVFASQSLRNLAQNGRVGNNTVISDKEILEMILFPVVNEACDVLDEGAMIRASDLDVASVLGMSFPSYRGGIFFWADTVGPSYIYRSLQKWAQLYGSFFKPTKFLEERVAKGLSLSEPAPTSSATVSRL